MLKDEGIKYELVADREPEHRTDSPLRLLHRVLRGRYRYVAILSTLLALAGGLVGYRLVEPVYQSTGLVRVEGAMPVILYPTQESAIPPMFEAYMTAQAVRLQSWKVLERAVLSQEMRDAGWPSGSYGVSRLHEAITVTLGRGEHIIRVAGSLPDPGQAQIAVNAVLAAYDRDHTYPGGLSPSNKEQILVEREEQLVQQIAQAHDQILDSSGQFGVSALDRIHARKLDELLSVERQLADIRQTRLRIAAGDTLQGDSFRDGLSPDDERELALRAEIASLEQRFRPGHPALLELNRRIEELRTQRLATSWVIRERPGATA